MQEFKLKLRERNIPNDKLLKDLKRVADLSGQKTVTTVYYSQKGYFSVNTFIRKFGSWNISLKTAGLEVIHTTNNTEEAFFENLANIWQQLGRQPVGRDMDKAKAMGNSKFSLGAYENRFGTWNKALTAFIYYINVSSGNRNIAVKSAQTKQMICKGQRTPRKIGWRLRAIVLIRDNCICQMCGASPAKDPSVELQADHIKPWSKGGETELDNLRTLCKVCNIGRSNAI